MQELRYKIGDESTFIKQFVYKIKNCKDTKKSRLLIEVVNIGNSNTVFFMEDKPFAVTIPCNCVLTSEKLEESIKVKNIDYLTLQEAAQQLLHTHIQYFTGDGMNPDELIFILNNHPNYKGIKYKKNLIEISEQNIQDIQKPKDRDFEMFPIFEDNHWITGFIHFDQNGKQIGYYTFDSHMKKEFGEISHKDISLKQDGSTQVLNDKNLQGQSGLCWLFTLECMKMAEDYKNFKDIQNSMFLPGQSIENKMDIKQDKYFQQKLYNQVNNTLQWNDSLKTLDKLSDGRSRSKLVGGNGYGKEYNLTQVERKKVQSNNAAYLNTPQTIINTPNIHNQSFKDIIADKIAYRQQQAKKSFVERIKLARENKERILKKYSTTHYNEGNIYRDNKGQIESWAELVRRNEQSSRQRE